MSIRNDPLRSRAVNLTLVQARINRRSVEALLEYYCAFRVSDLQTYQLSPYIHELEKLLSTTPRFKIGDRVKLPAEYGLGTVESVNVSYVVRRDSRTFCKNGSVWRESDCSEAPPEPTFEERVANAVNVISYLGSPHTRGAAIIEALRQDGFYIREVQ